MSKRILRVFPRRTSDTPTDDMAFVGDPGLFRPPADEVHISVAFKWDAAEAVRLQAAWSDYYRVVKMGGPALDGEGGEFTPGMYLRKGITITTRGCPHRCPWCLVRGPFRELKIQPGNILQDNNFCAASFPHVRSAIRMLNKQPRGAVFRGGLDTRILSQAHVDELAKLRSIRELWFAADTDDRLKGLQGASDLLGPLGLARAKRRCYVLLAFKGESIAKSTARLEAVWDLGFMPFAQLYQPIGERVAYDRQWRDLAAKWSQPKIMKAMHYTGREEA